MNAKEYIIAHPGIRPGHRAYGCALAVSKSGKRILRQLDPCIVELCSFDKQIEEKWYRDSSTVINYMVPVNTDGTLDWKRVMSVHQEGVCLADDYQDLSASLTTVSDAITHRLEQLQQQLNETETWVRKLHCGYIMTAALSLPPLDNQS